MNYTRAAALAADVYEQCDIRRLPFDCEAILKHYGLRAINVEQLKDTQAELYGLCLDFSEDSFLFHEGKMVIYRDIDSRRTRFSLMHELGHYLMKHSFCSPDEEWEANYFASYMLAPRPYIPYLGTVDPRKISRGLDISLKAAEIALNDYFNWWCDCKALQPWESRLLIRLLGPDYATSAAWRTHNCDYWTGIKYMNRQQAERSRHIKNLMKGTS